MSMVSYDNVVFDNRFCGIRDSGRDDDEGVYSTEGQLYEDLLEALSREFLKDKFSLCLQVRDEERVLYEFPKIPCPGLFLEQLRIRKI